MKELIFNFVNEHYIISVILVLAILLIMHQMYDTIKKRKNRKIEAQGVTIEPEPAQIQPKPYQEPPPYNPQVEQQQVEYLEQNTNEEFPLDLQQLGMGKETYSDKDIVEISKEQIKAMNEEIIKKANEYNEKLQVAKDLILQEEKKIYDNAQELIKRKAELEKARVNLEKNIAFTKPKK